MYIESKYSKSFISDNLTDLKYNLLKNYAILLRDIKNLISKEVNSDLFKFINMSKFEFISYMRLQHPKLISSYFDSLLYTLVFTCYSNKFDAIKHKITFNYKLFVLFNHYKRSTKGHKKGELKSIKYKNKTTNLSSCLTYLARYGNEFILDYIKSAYDKVDAKKQLYYDNILRCCDKFGVDRLYQLALRKRNRVLSNYINPIEFKSLTFSGKTNYLNSIIGYNKNRRSKIASFISINVPYCKGLDIPVKYSKHYHGNINDYKKQKDKALYCYIIKVDEFKNQVSVILCKDGLMYLPANKLNYVGIDVNVKHNLFALSDGSIYDFDRKLVNDYIKTLNEIDNLKTLNAEYQPGKRKRIKLAAFLRKIKQSNLLLISNVCKDLNSKGLNHIVLENLDNSFRKSYVKNQEYGEKYNRLTHILNIGSLKDEFKHIAVKYDISVSFVQPEYTSLYCEHCGCIDSENRISQEEFICINCGHHMNADIHAANNIKNRVTETVFQQALLKQNPDGSFIPKKLSHLSIKDKIQQSIVLILLNKSKYSNISS